MVEPNNEENYKSPFVEERFYQKPQSKHIIGEILRIDHVLKNCEEYFETIGVVAGWSRTVRQTGNGLAFIELNDGSTNNSIYIVVEGLISNFEQVSKTRTGACYRVRGKFCKSPAKNATIEVQVNDPENHYIKVLGNVEHKTYPLSGRAERHQYQFMRDIAHLRPRTKFISSITRISNSLVFATHLFFQNRGFLNIHTPIITTSNHTERGDMFQVTTMLPTPEESVNKIKMDANKQCIDYTQDFFKKPTFLSGSGKLSLETFACSMSNVYAFNPAFRALYGRTWRHLLEFWMVESEMAFGDINDAMDLAEAYLKFCVQYIFENNKEDLDYLEKEEALRNKDEEIKSFISMRENLRRILKSEFKRITYDEAIKICTADFDEKKANFEWKLNWGESLSLEHARHLSDRVFQQPMIIYNYPKELEGFHVRLNDDKKTVASMELFIPRVGEILKGSQKEDRLDILDERSGELKIDKEKYWWYRDLRKYGTVPHSGFGLGFERLVVLCTGADDIRNAIPFPRDHGNANF